MIDHRSSLPEEPDVFLHTGGLFGLLANGAFSPETQGHG